MITTAQVKQQCRIDADDTSEDTLLAIYISAAKRAIESHTNRTIYETTDDVPDAGDDTALIITDTFLDVDGNEKTDVADDINTAMLLMVGHWYAHRESVSEGQLVEVPHAFTFLIEPYRYINL